MTPAPRTRTFIRSLRSSVGLDGDASAEQIAVAVDIIRPADRWPVFGFLERRHRVGCLLATVRAAPFGGEQRRSRVRRVLERIVGAIHAPLLDRADLFPDRDHRLDEAIKL